MHRIEGGISFSFPQIIKEDAETAHAMLMFKIRIHALFKTI
jgi:hypothetical protein